MILSILICSIPERRDKLNALLAELSRQKDELRVAQPELFIDYVEVIVNLSERYLSGGKSIGHKRNELVQMAHGKYLALLDDDEAVAPNYIEVLYRLCLEDKDCVTFNCIVKNDFYWSLIDMSLAHNENEEVNPNGVIRRTVWHICPIRSEIAKSEQFNDINHNEDFDWMQRIIPKLQSEAKANTILTQYNHSEKNSEADKILKFGYD